MNLTATQNTLPVLVPAPHPARGMPTVDSQYLTFTLQDSVYGVDILQVREIIEYVRPSTVPMMPEFMHGVINLRGHVVPVIDLVRRFGRGATELRPRTCIVIVEVPTPAGPLALGILVDGVNTVLDLSPAQIEPPPAFGAGLRRDFVQGMARTDAGFIVLLHIAQVLAADEAESLAQAAQDAATSPS